MGIGYTSSLISVGVGYNATIGGSYKPKPDSKDAKKVAHTPVLVLNALDNAFRMAIPIQVYVNDTKDSGDSKTKVTAVSFDSQFRYYTGLDMLPQVRLLIYYGHQETQTKTTSADTKTKFDSFGFQFRIYFGSMVEEVALQPILRIQYKTALGKHGATDIKAVSFARNSGWTNVSSYGRDKAASFC